MDYENIIIGSGPAGLQCAYYFKKYNINYVVLERSAFSGSFFHQYPHSGKLISINKKNTGSTDADFNLRHDWNSLLNDEKLLFTDYSDEFYPKKEEMVSYLNVFAKNNDLNIQYNVSVNEVTKQGDEYKIVAEETTSNKKKRYFCKRLIVATGMSKPHVPNFILQVKNEIKHYGEYPSNYFLDKSNLEEFRNKRVLLFGGGNASFELANILNEVTSKILIAGRNKKDWAMSSHYAGDVRSIYLQFMDTFLLKSLNGIDYITELNDVDKNLRIVQTTLSGTYEVQHSNNNTNLFGKSFDKIIYCTGWKFDDSIFNFKIDMDKNLPNITADYQSTNNDHLFFIGALMQKFDHKRSSGAFVHGFRYLIKSFVNVNYNIGYDYKIMKLENNDDLTRVVDCIIERINTSSELYQMFSFMTDMIFYNPNSQRLIYYKNVPIIHVHNVLKNVETLFKNSDFILYVITLEFGNKKVENYKEFGDNNKGIGHESKSNLIHPVVRIFNPYTNELLEIYHLAEDIFSEFRDKKLYVDKLKRILRPI
jgi:thioredoxin reductase